MSRPVLQIPWAGAYNSWWSDEIDSVESMESEHFAEQDAEKLPRELRIDAAAFAEIFYYVTDYGAAYCDVAKAYAEAFNDFMSEAMNLKLELQFESMSSPREYNFTTDRIFCYVSPDALREMFERSARDNHKTLAAIIAERFTSRSGFISYYRHDLESWLEKPLTDYDHNEAGTLLLAAMKLADVPDDYESEIFCTLIEGSTFWNAFSDSVDWDKFESRVADLHEDKESELRELEPGYVKPPERCPLTLDLFRR